MPEYAPVCAVPRPFRPATAMRTVSLAPMTRPDDLVPPMANPAPMPAATERPRNSRRFRCDIDPLLPGCGKTPDRNPDYWGNYDRIGRRFPRFSPGCRGGWRGKMEDGG